MVLDDVTTHARVNMIFSPSNTWLLDSVASLHVTPHGKVRLGNSHKCDVIGIGDISLYFSDGSRFIMKYVCHVPQRTRNLIFAG